MEPDGDLDPDMDDLPLRANTSHILVRHYVLDLTVRFDRRVITGDVVLFLEPCRDLRTGSEDRVGAGAGPGFGTKVAGKSQDGTRDWDRAGVDTGDGNSVGIEEDNNIGQNTPRIRESFVAKEREGSEYQAAPGDSVQAGPEATDVPTLHPDTSWESTSNSDFTLVLDCCDLAVSKVEEVDVTSVSAMSGLLKEDLSEVSGVSSVSLPAALIQKLISIPSSQCRQQRRLFLQCSRAPGAQDDGSLRFHTDRWSLQVRKKGVTCPQEFPRALRICYETKPTGGSVRWTKDQDNRFV